MPDPSPRHLPARPRLSVVVPNFNHGRYLPACLDALLAQSVPADEILVVDDGSTDDSVAILHGYAARHPSLRVLAQPKNQGVVAAMNIGLAAARGVYLHFAGADDEVLPGLFEKSLALLERHPRAALSCTTSRWRDHANGLEWLMSDRVGSQPAFHDPAALVALERQGRLMIVSHSALLRADVVRELGGFRPELRWHCDWWVTYAGAFRHGLCHIPEVLSHVNLHGTSYYGSGHRAQQHAEVMDALLALLRDPACRDIADRVRDSGALALHGGPMLRAMLRHPGSRRFLTPRFLVKALVRQAQLVARRHFPLWLARWCIRVFLQRGRTR